MDRRKFLNRTTAAGITILTVPFLKSCAVEKRIKIGLITDVHKDIMHDADERLEAFLSEVEIQKSDFLIQMGDFCTPKEENKAFLELFNSYKIEKHHMIGNHEMDGGFSREDVVNFFGMPSKYYSFDKNGFHFVILDGNDLNPKPWSGYNRFIGDEQLMWLKDDIEKTELPTIIFSHQTLENEEGGVANLREVRAVLEEENKKSKGKVMACLSGHHHTDYHTEINGIHYVQINSASYRWVGGDWKTIRYSEDIDKKYPWIKYTIPYRDPLYAFMEISTDGYIKIEGRATEFVGPGPKEMKMPERPANDLIKPEISSLTIKL